MDLLELIKNQIQPMNNTVPCKKGKLLMEMQIRRRKSKRLSLDLPLLRKMNQRTKMKTVFRAFPFLDQVDLHP